MENQMENELANDLEKKNNEIWNKLSRISKIILNDNGENSKNLQIEWLKTLSAISADLDIYVDCFESSQDDLSDNEIADNETTDDLRNNKLNNFN